MDQNFSNTSPSGPLSPGQDQGGQIKEKIGGGIQGFLLNLGVIIALLSIYPSFLSFVFDILNSVFPDALDGRDYYYSISWQDSSIRWAMAILVVGVPVYILLSWLANKHTLALVIAQEGVSGKMKTGGRKILGSIIIFLASAVVVTDLIALVYYFFGGEVTTRFALKSLITLLSAGGVFWYYLYDIKRDLTVPSSGAKIGAIAVIVVTVVSIIFGFVVIGSPTQARYKKFDQTRVSNLQMIANGVGNFWNSKGVLPTKLDDISYFAGKIPVDPETRAAYRYSVIDERHFSICATFATDSTKNSPNATTYNDYYGYNAVGITDWSHGVGEKCFEGYLDPSVYKPLENSPIMVPKKN